MGGYKYSDEQIIECFEIMEEEGVSLKAACNKIGIAYEAIKKRVREDPNLSALDTKAREIYMRIQVERMNEIAMDESWSEATRKLLCDNIKWEAQRVGRKLYGERVQVEQTVKVDVDITYRKDQLRQMLDITPGQLTTDSKANMITGRNALESVIERGIANDGPVNHKQLISDAIDVVSIETKANNKQLTPSTANIQHANSGNSSSGTVRRNKKIPPTAQEPTAADKRREYMRKLMANKRAAKRQGQPDANGTAITVPEA